MHALGSVSRVRIHTVEPPFSASPRTINTSDRGLDTQLLEEREGDGAVRAELAIGQRRVERPIAADGVPVFDHAADELLARGGMIAEAAERLGDGVGRVDRVEDRAQRQALR